jgi:hypothetical protein
MVLQLVVEVVDVSQYALFEQYRHLGAERRRTRSRGGGHLFVGV